MVTVAFWTLAGAVVLGSAAAVLGLLQETVPIRSWPVGAVHGTLAALGFALLVLALPGSTRGLQTGTASFGVIAAVLMAVALLFGLALLALRLLKRRLPGLLVGTHATLAIGGFAILIAYLFSG